MGTEAKGPSGAGSLSRHHLKQTRNHRQYSFNSEKELNGKRIGRDAQRDDITDSDSHPPLPHSPFPRLCLVPKLPPTYASNIHPGHPSTCHSHVHICHRGLPAPAKLGRRTCSDRRSTGRSGGGGSHMLLC